MTHAVDRPIPTCPKCGTLALRSDTRYGLRDACEQCGLRSWGGKELVSEAVLRARHCCHEAFDPLWEDASWIDIIAEPLGAPGTPERKRTVERIQKRAQKLTYAYFAATLNLPVKEVHMGDQTDVATLRRIYDLAGRTSPSDIQAWAQARGDDVLKAPPSPAPQPRRERPVRNRPCPCGAVHPEKGCALNYKQCHGRAEGPPPFARPWPSGLPGYPLLGVEQDMDALRLDDDGTECSHEHEAGR